VGANFDTNDIRFAAVERDRIDDFQDGKRSANLADLPSERQQVSKLRRIADLEISDAGYLPKITRWFFCISALALASQMHSVWVS
jgi:hypothetical protein